MTDNDYEQLDLWAEAMRRDNKIWNKGFRWGCFWAFLISISTVFLIGWFASPT